LNEGNWTTGIVVKKIVAFEMSIWHLKSLKKIDQIPSGQYVDKNNCTRRVRNGKEWERTGKPLKSLGGCNF
jgi:hypothetical protein